MIMFLSLMILRLQGKTTQPFMVVPICMHVCSVASAVLTLCNAIDCSLPGSSYTWDSPGKNTEVGGHGIKPASPALQADFLPLTHWGCPVPVYFMLMSQLGLSCNLSPLLILKYYTLCIFTNPYAIISLPILLVLFISVQLLARLPCPSPTPRVCSNSCPSSQ